MGDKSAFNFKPWGQGMTRGRGRGRGRSRAGRARGLVRLCTAPRFQKASQEHQVSQRMHTEGEQKTPDFSQSAGFFSQVEIGNPDLKRSPEDVLSPESSSSSKRSCTEMEESEETKSKLLKRRCKKSLSGNFACSRDSDGISVDVGHKGACNVSSGGENWDEEIENEQRSTQRHGPPGLQLVQDAYDSSGSTGTEPIGGQKEANSFKWNKNQNEKDKLKVRDLAPTNNIPNPEVESLSNAVIENCNCTSDEDAQRYLKDPRKLLAKGESSQSFSSPTAGSKSRPHVHERSKSDSWISGITKAKNSKKKEKTKRRHRSATIMECDESSDEDIGTDTSLRSASSKGPKGRHRRASQSSEDLINTCKSSIHYPRVDKMKVDHQKAHHASTKSSSAAHVAHESEDCEADVESSQADEYDSPADEQWNSVVRKLSAEGADTEDVPCAKSKINALVDEDSSCQQFPNLIGQQTDMYQNSMDRPLQFQPGFRARHPHPHHMFSMAYDNPSMQAMSYQYPYPPPPPHMWQMMANPYFCGASMYGGFYPDPATMPAYESCPGNLASQTNEHVGMDFTDDIACPETFSQEYVDPSKCGLFEEEENNVGYSHSVQEADPRIDDSKEHNYVRSHEAYGGRKSTSPESAAPKMFIPRQLHSYSKNSSQSSSLMSQDQEAVEPSSSFPSTVDIQPQSYEYMSEEAQEQKRQGSSLVAAQDTDQQPKQKRNWYDGPEASSEMESSLRRKSKVWGKSITSMTHPVDGNKQETLPPQKSIPVVPKKEYCPPSYAAIAASTQKTSCASSVLTKKDDAQSSSQGLEWRSGFNTNAPTMTRSWRPKLSPTDYVSPQDKLNNLSKLSFWQKSPSPPPTTTDKKFRTWTSGSQGWGSLNMTTIPRRISEPPKPIEIIHRPRRFSLEDQVRAETAPRTLSWKSSSESEDTSEVHYPVSDIDYIDSHCHIDLLFQRHNHRGTFSKFSLINKYPANFAGCVAIFCYPFNFSSGYTLADDLLKEANIWGSFGCHPHQVKHYDGVMEKRIRDWMNHPKTVAFGEIGLDYSDRPIEITSDHVLQKMIFRRQLELALEVKKPLVIHCRDAEDDTLGIMLEMVPRNHRIHRHCFTGPPEDALTFLRAFPNSYIGLTALVTFPTATNTHQTARAIPLNRLLLETDTPYFVPRKIRGAKWSHPAMAILVAERIAQLRGIQIDEVLTAVRENTMSMYGI